MGRECRRAAAPRKASIAYAAILPFFARMDATLIFKIGHRAAILAACLMIALALAPLGRIGQPEEVAALIHFLAAGDCGYVTGEAIVIDGGWLAGPAIAVFERLAVGPPR